MADNTPFRRPTLILVLAMSADGKIADAARSPARFGSEHDRAHLERQIAAADGFLFGAGTLRAYGTSLPIRNPDLLRDRQAQHKPPQPPHIVCSVSGRLDKTWRFFQQPIPRWLLTTDREAEAWQENDEFERVIGVPQHGKGLDWAIALPQLQEAGLQRIVVGGGGTLAASLLDAGLLDELWLTVCPRLLGGTHAPTPIDGDGWQVAHAPTLDLLSTDVMGNEVLLHYAIRQ